MSPYRSGEDKDGCGLTRCAAALDYAGWSADQGGLGLAIDNALVRCRVNQVERMMDTAYTPLLIALGVCGLLALAGLAINLYRLYGDALLHRAMRTSCIVCGKRARVSRRNVLLGYVRCRRCGQKVLLPQVSSYRLRNRF